MTLVAEPQSAPALSEALTEEECYLAAILMDRSGVDLAEFLWPDPSSPDGCFRLYPFQWAWWRDEQPRSVDQCSRDVGKCLVGSTLIMLADGTRARIDSLVGQQVAIIAPTLDNDIAPRPVAHVYETGTREVVRITTRLGRHVTCSLEHRFLTPRGAMTAGELGTGCQIAISRELPFFGSQELPDCDIRILALLICDGKITQATPSYTKGDSALVEDLRDAVRSFDNVDVQTQWNDENNAWECLITRRELRGHGRSNPVTDMLRSYECHGLRSIHKSVPEAIYTAPEHQVALFLGRLFSGDGCVEYDRHRSGRRCVTYSSSSFALVEGVRHLLTRFGILASVRPKKNAAVKGGKKFQSWELRIPPGYVRCFHETIGCYMIGVKRPLLDELAKDLDGTTVRCRLDEQLDGKLNWDQVRSIDPAGVEPCYDIEMQGGPAYLANDIVVHNSERICARACVHPFVNPGEEHALVAPEGSHIDRLTGRIEQRIKSVRLLLEMVAGGARGITHQPFEVKWRNLAQTYSRLPQRSGIGLKGIHSVWLDIDEAQDLSERAWAEVGLTVRFDIPGARWTCHGVSKGVHDEFWRKTQPNSGWVVYRLTQLHKPNFDNSPEARAQLIKDNGGSEESGDFKRNVYGEHGDTQNRIFILAHLMSAVDDRKEGSDINDEYYQPTIVGDEVAARVGSKVAVESSSEEATEAVISMCEFPLSHVNGRFKTFWAGMDVGLVGDPSEICICAEYVPEKRELSLHRKLEISTPDEGISRLRLMTRIRILRLPEPLQADLIMWLIDFYRPRAFALDAGGNGLPLLQELQKRAGKSRIMAIEPPQLADNATGDERAAWLTQMAEFDERRKQASQALTVIKGYKFGSKLIVDFDEEKVAELGGTPSMKDMIEKAAIHQEAKTRATDMLRTMVDNRRFLFPSDDEFVDQMNGQTFTYSAEPIDAYGRRRAVYSAGSFHILDAMRFLALGYSQEQIEKLVAKAEEPPGPVLARFVSF